MSSASLARGAQCALRALPPALLLALLMLLVHQVLLVHQLVQLVHLVQLVLQPQ